MERIKISNSRLLLVESLDEGRDWQEKWLQLKDFIEENSSLSLAHSGLYLYFFSPTSDEHFIEHGLQVGVEILGFTEEVPEGFQVWDLHETEIEEFSMTSLPDWDQLFLTEAKARESSVNSLANTWRVKIPLQGTCLKAREIKIQFFKDKS